MASVMIELGETQRDGYQVCDKCGTKTMLISAPSCWSVDQEAFMSGERTDNNPDVPEYVEVGAEVTGHWCDSCEKLTSVSMHQT